MDTLEDCCRLIEAAIQGQTSIDPQTVDACRKVALDLRRRGLSDGARMIEDRLQALPAARAISPRLKALYIIAAIDALTDADLAGLDGETRFKLWTAVSTLDESLSSVPVDGH